MNRDQAALPLDGYRVALTAPNILAIDPVRADVDGEDWGLLNVEEVQRRLEQEDDFAIVQLEADLVSRAAVPGLVVRLNAGGLRRVDLDGTYLTPTEKDLGPDLVGYGLPDPLPAGTHRLAWSCAWNPPEGGDGVTLAVPRIVGSFADPEGQLAPLPEHVDLLRLGEVGLASAEARLSLSRYVEVPPAYKVLHVQGPLAGSLSIAADGDDLAVISEAPMRFSVPPHLDGKVHLTLQFTGSPAPVTMMRLMR